MAARYACCAPRVIPQLAVDAIPTNGSPTDTLDDALRPRVHAPTSVVDDASWQWFHALPRVHLAPQYTR
jgi:hypothetical protein